MRIKSFDIEKALDYARKWALLRNPNYYDFKDQDCTNFISQCVYAGSGIMNYTKNYGWYYKSIHSRSPAWTGTQPFYNFIIGNRGVGPFGFEIAFEDVRAGDIAQLLFWGKSTYSHSLLILEVGEEPELDNILIACHAIDALYKPLSAYYFKAIRFIRIQGVRTI